MKGRNANSQVLDLISTPCPMNLVKFKYNLYKGEMKTVLISKEGAALKNICDFLQFKNIPFKIKEDNKSYIIKF